MMERKGITGGKERGRGIIVGEVDHVLVKPYLGLEKLNVVNSLVQHGNCVHLCPPRNHALQDLEPVTDSVPPFPSSHALWISGQLHSSFGATSFCDLFLLLGANRHRRGRASWVRSREVSIIHWEEMRRETSLRELARNLSSSCGFYIERQILNEFEERHHVGQSIFGAGYGCLHYT